MTDLYDINTRGRGRKWRGTLITLDSICSVCGCRYGAHLGNDCPDEDIPPIKSPHNKVEKHWECYVEGSDGGRHYHHWTEPGARVEAERLARLSGRTVYLFECIGQCRAEPIPVKWVIPHV